jgi:hypothetical protein
MKEFLLALMFVVISNATYAQSSEPKDSPTPEPPQVEIISQPNSPLRIKSVQTKWAVPSRSGIELYTVVENLSVKAISAYTTRDDGGSVDPISCFGLRAKSLGKALRQGQSEGKSTWRGYNPSSHLRRLVDFVEFTDGTTWGEDVCGTAESLAGSRAGAREARKLLREVFAAEGVDAVLSRVKTGLTEIEPPPNQSLRWKEAFLGGVKSYVERIRQADQEWGYTEIEHALQRPIDGLEEKEF